MISNTLSVDVGLQQYMTSLFSKVGLGLGLAGILAFLVGSVPALTAFLLVGPFKWVLLLATIGIIFYISFKFDSMTTDQVKFWYWTFVSLIGVTLGSAFVIYKLASVVQIFFITSSVFLAASLYGYVTKRDLTNFGSFLIIGAVGIIIAGLVNLFLQSSVLVFVISLLAVVIFTGLTAYDVQNQKELYLSNRYEDLSKVAYMGALSLFLNFVNIFQALLSLLGDRK